MAQITLTSDIYNVSWNSNACSKVMYNGTKVWERNLRELFAATNAGFRYRESDGYMKSVNYLAHYNPGRIYSYDIVNGSTGNVMATVYETLSVDCTKFAVNVVTATGYKTAQTFPQEFDTMDIVAAAKAGNDYCIDFDLLKID